MSFRCPICHSSEYQRVTVKREKGRDYETEFFECLGCTTMFREPELFADAPQFRGTDQPRDSMKAWEVAHRALEIRQRRERAKKTRDGK